MQTLYITTNLHNHQLHSPLFHIYSHTNVLVCTQVLTHTVCLVSVAGGNPSAPVALVTGHRLVLRGAPGLCLPRQAVCLAVCVCVSVCLRSLSVVAICACACASVHSSLRDCHYRITQQFLGLCNETTPLCATFKRMLRLSYRQEWCRKCLSFVRLTNCTFRGQSYT